MKKFVVVLCVAMLTIFGVGAAFAAESINTENTTVKQATVADVSADVTGATVDKVLGFTADEKDALIEAMGPELTELASTIDWGNVFATLTDANGTLTIALTGDYFYIYDHTVVDGAPVGFVDVLAVYAEEAAGRAEGPAWDIDWQSKWNGAYVPEGDNRKVEYAFARVTEEGWHSSSSGCSALTLGALALFLAPMGVVAVRRNKK